MELSEVIKEKIKKEGAISFEEFMEIALYYPEIGYYTSPKTKIGREGDFFTASHLGAVFGILLAKAIEEFYLKMNKPYDFSITEIGPGMGYLAEDILSNLSFSPRYYLVEINPHLVKIQKSKLKKFRKILAWYRYIDELSELKGVIILNEVFDALPVRIFEIRDKPYEVYLTVDETENLKETLLPARAETTAYLKDFAPWVFDFEGYRSEINLKAKAFIEKLAQKLKIGYLMIFDYGYISQEYYSDQRNRGTLLCYHKHTISENPYLNIGKQDITAHVNFTAIEKWATEAGFKVVHFSSQSKYLISLCDEVLLNKLNKLGLIQQFKRLVLPQGMGESHRVMILSKNTLQ